MTSCRLKPASAERGVALVVVMVMLLLTTFALLTNHRVGWLNEKLVGSESDHERAFAAAEALIRDAEMDINGRRFDGVPCPANPATQFGCRNLSAPHFPLGDDDLDTILTRVAGGFANCSQGICLPVNTTALEVAGAWTTQLASMQAVGATYGQFTGANPLAAGNPLLTAGRAWYWVEVFRYDAEGVNSNATAITVPVPVREHPYVYRITAYVQGTKPGTQVRLRSTFVPFLARDFE
jgi:type IV pilus assembly protein PilX